MRRKVVLISACTLALALAGCGGGFSANEDDLVIYSGREEELVGPLIERFEEETGIDVAVRYANSSELAATLAEEGDNSPADVFWAQDPGALGAVENEGRLPSCPSRCSNESPSASATLTVAGPACPGRVRVIAFNTDEVREDEVPDRSTRSPTRAGAARSGSRLQRLLPGIRERDAPRPR